jgi:hypothetical protein
MSALEYILEQCSALRGIEHINAIRTLRSYIRLTPEDEVVLAINRITNIMLLKHIIEAGVNARLQKATLTRYDLLKKEQGGGT